MAESWEKTCPLDVEQVTKAVNALKSYIAKTKKDEDTSLLNEHSSIRLQVTFHRIPALKQKSIYVQLPHRIYTEATDVCLITKDVDREDTEKSEEHYRKVLADCGISSIAKVLPISLLKSDYRAYASRRRLADMHDLFLCDEDILYRMPALLGKIFYEKKKNPWGIKVSSSDFKQEVDKTLGQTRWYLSGNGSSSIMTVALATFSVSQIVENIMTCAVEVAKKAPRGWNNVISLNIKTDKSIALPVYYNDAPTDVDDVDVREYHYLRHRKIMRENKRRLHSLLGMEERKQGKLMMRLPRKRKPESNVTDNGA